MIYREFMSALHGRRVFHKDSGRSFTRTELWFMLPISELKQIIDRNHPYYAYDDKWGFRNGMHDGSYVKGYDN